MMETLKIPLDSMRQRPYQDKQGLTVYTYHIDVQDFQQAAAILGINGQEYQNCQINTRFLKPRDGEPRRPRADRAPNAFAAFNRDQIGSAQQTDDAQPAAALTRDALGSNFQQQ